VLRQLRQNVFLQADALVIVLKTSAVVLVSQSKFPDAWHTTNQDLEEACNVIVTH